MPIKIVPLDRPKEEIAWLCGEIWELPTQLQALEKWLDENHHLLPKKTIADIGFRIRENAFGGGAIFKAESMKQFSDYNMDIQFSEYPN